MRHLYCKTDLGVIYMEAIAGIFGVDELSKGTNEEKGQRSKNRKYWKFILPGKRWKKKNFRKRVVLDLRGGMEWCLEVKRKLWLKRDGNRV